MNQIKRNPPHSSWEISLKTENVNLMVASEEKSGDYQSQWDSVSGKYWYLFKILQ